MLKLAAITHRYIHCSRLNTIWRKQLKAQNKRITNRLLMDDIVVSALFSNLSLIDRLLPDIG